MVEAKKICPKIYCQEYFSCVGPADYSPQPLASMARSVRMITFIETTAMQAREGCFSGYYHGNCDLVISLFLHYTMMQNKTMLIFYNANSDAKLNGFPRFSFYLYIWIKTSKQEIRRVLLNNEFVGQPRTALKL